MKAKLVLVISDKMDSNQKQDRYEDRLIRMGERARNNLGLKDEKSVELWPNGSTKDRISRSKVLDIFQAYASDLKKAKMAVSAKDFNNVGFVTSKTYKFICTDKGKKKSNIWIADTIEDTIIGADPEFVLMNGDGTIKYASEVAGFSHADILGSDGPLAEVRPDPAVDISDFVRNIKHILNNHENVELIKKYKWMSGCYYYAKQEDSYERTWPLGGHIHIGTPARLARAIDSFGKFYETSVYSCLDRVLDEYVAIPAIKIDGKKNSNLRRKEFGEFGDVRTNHDRLEYRSLSGEWLTHPKMAEIVVGTVKAIAHEFFKILDEGDYKHAMVMTGKQQSSDDEDDFEFFDIGSNYWKDIEMMKYFSTTKSSDAMREILDKSKIEFSKQYFTKLKAKLRNLSVYKNYSEYIDAFIEVVSLPNDVLKDRDKELKRTWKGKAKFVV
jgi:hypothetical protein